MLSILCSLHMSRNMKNWFCLKLFLQKTNLKQSWQLEHFEHIILIWPDLINNITTTDVEQKTEIKTTGRVRCDSIRRHPGFQDIGNYNKRRWRIRSSFSSKTFIHIQDDILVVIKIKITRYTRHRYESVNHPDEPINRQMKSITSSQNFILSQIVNTNLN